ncbi:MAG TPA: hypothetical protein VF746_17795 [Longimicrobium sp.]|jgi:hypothetical protein
MKLLPLGLAIAVLAAPAPCVAGGSLSRCAIPLPQPSFERADAVFRGVVVSTPVGPERDGSAGGPSYRWATVRVTTRWKGVVPGTVRIRGSQVGVGDDIHFSFERGAEYLIYAKYSGDVLTAGNCSGTRRIEQAASFLEALPEPLPETAAP